MLTLTSQVAPPVIIPGVQYSRPSTGYRQGRLSICKAFYLQAFLMCIASDIVTCPLERSFSYHPVTYPFVSRQEQRAMFFKLR